MKMSRLAFKKTIVITRRKAPRIAQKIVKNAALSTAAAIFIHHKPPEGTVILDATVIEGLETCIKILTHF